MFRILGSARARRATVMAVGAVSALLIAESALAQQPTPYVFPNGAGLVLNFIKPDKATEWEGIIDKLAAALKASEKPERQAQAKAWRIYKASEQPVKDAVLYLWILDGAPVDQEYSMVKMMTELFPKEAADLYKQYSDAYVPPAQQIFHLSPVKDYSK